MNFKFQKIFQTLILINLTSEISTTTVDCSFDNIVISLERFNNFQGYGCDIQSLSSAEPQNPLKFIGNHDYDKTNDDVTVVKYQLYEEYQPLQFDSSFCEKFPNIETIFISELQILSIDQNSLENCQKLSKMFFYGNKIRELPENLLDKNSNLTALNLDINYLTELPEDFLKNQNNLEDLGLTNNQINFLPSNIFRSLEKLKFLRLERNRISVIDPNWLVNLRNLDTLVLEDNKITNLPNRCFKFQSKLADLNLRNNLITSITSAAFTGLKSLRILNLDYNKIEDLPKNVFKDSRDLESLSIAYNRLSTIHSDSFGILTKFTRLHCYSNEIEGVDEKLIDKTAVEDLDLTGNICIDGAIYNRDNMKKNLSICFDNYQERIEEDEETIEDDNTESILTVEEETTPTIFKMVVTTTTPIEPTTITISTTLPSTTQSTTTSPQAITTTTISTEPLTTISTTSTTEKSTALTTEKSTTYPTTLSPIVDTKIQTATDCGKPKMGLPTIVKGTTVVRGSFPWNAALLKLDGSFFCGGTLVSKEKVVTAAHCLKGKYQSHTFNAGDIIVALGAHDLSKSIEVGRIFVAVKKISNHPDWNPNTASFDADIAVLELDHEVTFTRFVQPICLMQPESEVEAAINGIVAGFGRSEAKNVESIARVIDIPIYSYEECLKSKEHEKLLSQRTICGGHANGTGVCVGDSGGGLYVSYQNTYYLRGIVSASLHGDNYGCNVDAYAVFTDVIKFRNWIETGEVEEVTHGQDIMSLLKKYGIKSLEDLKKLGLF